MSNAALALLVKFGLDSAKDIGAALIAERDERQRVNAEASDPANYLTVHDDTVLVRRFSPSQN